MNPLLKPRHLANHYLELLSCSDHRDSLMFSLSIQIIIINKAKEVLCKKAFIKFLILPIESTRRKEGWKDIFLMRSVHNLIISSILHLILGYKGKHWTSMSAPLGACPEYSSTQCWKGEKMLTLDLTSSLKKVRVVGWIIPSPMRLVISFFGYHSQVFCIDLPLGDILPQRGFATPSPHTSYPYSY